MILYEYIFGTTRSKQFSSNMNHGERKGKGLDRLIHNGNIMGVENERLQYLN